MRSRPPEPTPTSRPDGEQHGSSAAAPDAQPHPEHPEQRRNLVMLAVGVALLAAASGARTG